MKVSDAKTEILIMAKYRRFNVQLNRDSLYYHHKKLISSQIEEAISLLGTDIGDQVVILMTKWANIWTYTYLNISEHPNIRTFKYLIICEN